MVRQNAVIAIICAALLVFFSIVAWLVYSCTRSDRLSNLADSESVDDLPLSQVFEGQRASRRNREREEDAGQRAPRRNREREDVGPIGIRGLPR